MRLRRRKASTLAVMGAVLTLVLGACGSEEEPTDGSAAEQPQATETPEDAGAGEDDAASGEGDLVVNGEVIADAETYAAAQEEGPISAYLAYGEAAMTAILEVFTEDTGLEVDFLQQPTGQMVERVLTEKGADAFPADVVMVPEDANLNAFVDAGVYREHSVPNADEYDDAYIDPSGLFVRPVSGSSTLAFNHGLLDEADAPTTYEDLLKPEYRGQIGLVPITQGATGYTFWRMLLEEYGIEYWEQMAEQDVLLQPGTGPLHDELTRGEYAIAVGRPPIIGTQIEDGAPLTMVFPEGDKTPGWTWGVGVVDGADNENGAEILVNWFMSMRGQETFALVSGDFPTHPDAPTPEVQGEPLPTPDFYFHDDTEEEVQENIAKWEQVFNFSG